LPNWTNVGVTKDLAGIDRVIAAERTQTDGEVVAKIESGVG
jgi:hypothetical protein